MIQQQFSILLVVLPLLAAPVAVFINNGRFAWLLTTLVTLACLGMSGSILLDVLDGSTIHYELGGWSAPWGIAYRIDALNGLIAVIVSAMAFVTSLYAKKSVPREIPQHLHAMFYAAYLLCFLGLLGIALTGDIFNMFVFLEVSSLATYALIALGHNRSALTASFKYLVLGTLGATFFLIGVGFMYAATGTLNIEDMAQKMPAVKDMQLVHTGFAMIVVGLALKAAVYPLHLWLPNAYTYAPSVITVFLSATATKVAIYALLRSMFHIYGFDFVMESLLPPLLVILGSIGIIYGSTQAIWQTDMKRMLAYSSVAQIGYIMLGVGLMSQAGVAASLLHVFNHSLMKALLFMTAGLFYYRANTTQMDGLRGMARDMPWTFAAMIIGAFSLIGVPGTVGFVSKWYLLQAALEQQQWSLIGIILVGSLLAIIYLWKFVEALYFQQEEKLRVQFVTSGDETVGNSPVGMTVAIWLLVLGCIYFGLNTDLTVAVAEGAAQLLVPVQEVQP